MDKKDFIFAAKILKTGGVIVYPTDTAYALGCKFRNKLGIKTILKIKGRKDTKFTLIAASLQQVKKFFNLNSLQITLAKKYWPGPLSIVVNKKYAVRVPANEIARDLARKAGEPLIATSYNKSGAPETYYLSKQMLNNQQPDFMINIGRLKKRPPSTIIKIQRDKVLILRQGPIKL